MLCDFNKRLRISCEYQLPDWLFLVPSMYFSNYVIYLNDLFGVITESFVNWNLFKDLGGEVLF